MSIASVSTRQQHAPLSTGRRTPATAAPSALTAPGPAVRDGFSWHCESQRAHCRRTICLARVRAAADDRRSIHTHSSRNTRKALTDGSAESTYYRDTARYDDTQMSDRWGGTTADSWLPPCQTVAHEEYASFEQLYHWLNVRIKSSQRLLRSSLHDGLEPPNQLRFQCRARNWLCQRDCLAHS